MKHGWQVLLLLLLALSIGLNAGLLIRRGAESGSEGAREAAAPPRGQPGPPPPVDAVIREHLAGMSAHLSLDSGQREGIRRLLEKHMPEMMALRRRTAEANHKISEVFAAPEFDAREFERRVEEASRARSSADSLSALMLMEQAGLLSAEQRVKFAEVAPVIYSNPRQAPPPAGREAAPPPPRRAPPQGGP